MTAAALDGRRVAAAIRAGVSEEAAALLARGHRPTLGIVMATEDEGAAWYVRSLGRAAEKAGIAVRVVELPAGAAETDVAAALDGLAADPGVDGVILQTPVPAGLHAVSLASAIPPEKDVDGASPLSAGRVMAGLPAFAPATAAAVMELLGAYDVPLCGRRAVVVGRSMVVGKPLAHLLLAKDATVTVCHSRTRDLAAVAREAEVLVAAVGRPRLIGREHVRPGAVVVDVGTTPDEAGNLAGDVDAAAIEDVAAALSPVPGGVGPVTTALLLRNTVTAAASRRPAS